MVWQEWNSGKECEAVGSTTERRLPAVGGVPGSGWSNDAECLVGQLVGWATRGIGEANYSVQRAKGPSNESYLFGNPARCSRMTN
jgi:hypothetical protein